MPLVSYIGVIMCHLSCVIDLRTFEPIATAHPYSAGKFTCHIMHRAPALSTKINNDSRADGYCYSSAWIKQSWMFSDPYFSFQKQI